MRGADPMTTAAAQPTLAELTVRFLASRSDAATAAVEPAGEVEPHEVAAGFRVDARVAWADAVAPLNPGAHAPGSPLPTDWAGVVNHPAPAYAVPMAAGNIPQRVKDLHPLLGSFDPVKLRAVESAPPMTAGLRAWVEKTAPTNALLAAGVARAAGDTDRAGELLAGTNGPAADNERAALLWQIGQFAAAAVVWEGMAETPAVLFNRGLARLFLGRPADAKPALRAAAAALPEGSGWHALAELYLAVAEMQG